jgi:Spy/CpxP family protein refolding chaperone
MKKLMFVLLVLMAAGLVSADEFDLPPGRWWENERLIEHVGLSEEQQAQIRDIVYEHARRMIDLKATVEKAGLDLRASVDQKEFDPAPVRDAHARFQTARQKLESERFEMLLAVRQVLTYEQWQKIEGLKQRVQQNRGDQRRPPGQRYQPGQRPGGERPPDFQ